MSGELVYLLETVPLNASGVATPVNFSMGLLTEADLASTGQKYPVRLLQAYTHETSVFEENVPGQTSISLGSSTINNTDGRFDYLLDYAWDARPVTIKRGRVGDPYASYVTEFVGSATELTADTDNLVLTLRDNSYKLIKPVQPNKYAGTLGAEGGADLQNKFKPLLFGKIRNASPVWVDQVLLTWQIHDGAITSVDAVYDRGNKLTFYQNYASYALLIAATIPPGYYATCLSAGFGRLGAPPAGTLTVDAVGAFGSVTNVPELAKQLITTRLGLTAGEIDTAAFTQASIDAPWAFEGLYYPEPEIQYDELMETLASSVNGFWCVTRTGLISFKIFKFGTPVATLRAEDLSNLGKAPSPKPLYRVKVDYAKNATVQPPSDFTIPKQLINAYLDKEYHFVDTSVGSPNYSGAGRMNVFLNDQNVNDLGIANFSIPNGESWIAINSTGDITVTSSGAASATAIVRVNIGEYVWDEPFTLIRDSSSPLQKIDLSLSADRFYFNDAGQPSPAVQTITVTATGTNTTAPITVTAVDNLGNSVPVSSNTISITNISTSPLLFWIAVTATDANGVKQTKRIMVQHGNDAYAEGILGSYASSGATFFFQGTAPTSGMVTDDVWVNTADANKTYRWTGSIWAAFSDTRIIDALTAAAGAQATADGKIKTYVSTTSPSGTFAIGDLWWEPTSHILKRWSGSSWDPFSAASLADLDPIANSAVANLVDDNVLTVSEKPTLIAFNAQLEIRFSQVRARALALGISTSALDTARNDWISYLGNIQTPAWNDTTQDSRIYNSIYPDSLFPTNWSAVNGLTTAANGAYTTLTDPGASPANLSRSQASSGVRTYSAGIVVKKDTTGKSTRYINFRFLGAGGTQKFGDMNVDTSTGEFSVPSSFDICGVMDLGSEWFVYAQLTTNSDNTSIQMALFPAAGAGALTTTVSSATTGSADFRDPVLANGSIANLGRSMLIGRMNSYRSELDKLNKAISEIDAQLANQITGPAAFTAEYDSSGSTPNNLPANLSYKLQNQAGQITSGITWKYVVIAGTVNGHAAGATEYTDTMTNDTGTGVLTLNSMVGSNAKLEIRAYIGTTKWPFQTNITKSLAPASGGGGGGGTGSSGSVNTVVTGTTFVKVGSVVFTTGAGQTSVSLSASCDISCNSIAKSDSTTVELKWMRSGVQKGSTGSGSCSIVNWEPQDGIVSASGTDTGLTANTSYTWELWARTTISGKSASIMGAGTVT